RYEHGVAVTEEAVALAHGVAVSGEHAFPSRERADQHEQRGFREMEVREHRIHRAELEPGADEEIRLPLHRLEGSRQRCGLETADAGGAHRHDAPAAGARRLDRVAEARRHLEPLAVHSMILEALAAQ